MPSGKWVRIVCVALAVAGVSAGVRASARQVRVTTAQKVTPELIAKRRAELQTVLDAYAAGDREAAAREFRQRPDSVTRQALAAILGDKDAPWQSARAAFALEAAVGWHRVSGFFSTTSIVRLGRAIVLGRPAPIGTNAIEDRFEVMWHQTALALIQSAGDWGAHDEYLRTIMPRMVLMTQATPPVPSRFALARAINATMRCCKEMVSPVAGQMVIISSGSRRVREPVVTQNDSVALFEAAAADPLLRSEALVRKAFLEQFLERLPQAMASLDGAPPIADDTLTYAASLIRGGLCDRLGRPEAAAEAYQAALDVAPDAQIPAIGRAAALQRSGRTDEALAAADRARRLFGSDPWPTFLRMDARYINEWLQELRGLLR